MLFEVGKKYRSRNGKCIFKIKEIIKERAYPIRAVCVFTSPEEYMTADERTEHVFSLNGVWEVSPADTGRYDLVEEVKEDMILEIGKKYITRSGRCVKIKCKSHVLEGRFDGIFMHDQGLYWWESNGKFGGADASSLNTIVGEWPEEEEEIVTAAPLPSQPSQENILSTRFFEDIRPLVRELEEFL